MINTRPRLVESDSRALLVEIHEMGTAPAKSLMAYSSDWVEVVYDDGTTVWFRADMVRRVLWKDKDQLEAEARDRHPSGKGAPDEMS